MMMGNMSTVTKTPRHFRLFEVQYVLYCTVLRYECTTIAWRKPLCEHNDAEALVARDACQPCLVLPCQPLSGYGGMDQE